MEKTDHILISAQNGFKLGATCGLTKNPEFKGAHDKLVEQADIKVSNYRKDMKALCLEQTKLEQLVKQSEIEDLLCEAYCSLAKLMCANNGISDSLSDYLLQLTIDKNPNLLTICCCSTITKLNLFRARY